MKRSLMLLMVSALLISGLTACGCASKDAGTVQDNQTVTETPQNGTENNGSTTVPNDNNTVNDNTANGNIANNGTDNNGGLMEDGKDIIEDTGEAIRDGVNDVTGAVTGNGANSTNDGVAIDDMLRNGNVRNNVR